MDDDFPREFITKKKEKGALDDEYSEHANKFFFVDIREQFDYENTHDQHVRVWKSFPQKAHEENLEILDDQLESYRKHYICSGTNVITPGCGNYKPDIVFIMRSPGKRDASSSNFTREAFMDSGQIVRRIANTEFKDSTCYFMFLIPFNINDLTADSDVFNGNKDATKIENWFRIPDNDHQVFLDYAKQRLICLNPKIVVCLGDNVLKIVMANFKLSSVSTLDRVDILRKKCITEDTKLKVANYCNPIVIPFPTPYHYSKFLTDKIVGFKGRNVEEDWDESLIKLKKVVSRKNETGNALERMMKSSKEDAKLAKLSKDKKLQTSIKNWGEKKPEKGKKGIRRPRVEYIGYDPKQCTIGIETFKRKSADDTEIREIKRSKTTYNDEDLETFSSTKDEIIF